MQEPTLTLSEWRNFSRCMDLIRHHREMVVYADWEMDLKRYHLGLMLRYIDKAERVLRRAGVDNEFKREWIIQKETGAIEFVNKIMRTA